ncbi:Alpha- and gamma-adaptin-binding protein p34 [Pseudolycoriella hygida]|uniref:Alpha- and gamma-adaptin-binding protein p34 n=1 Tax=Pseudolycoriella hygida TaxID=35572 RepID=A0A9Q0N372_9DIPT|nr:Alpha- and gamma-adaptin-binding protein p34 [Pseudolycoriella hygida]
MEQEMNSLPIVLVLSEGDVKPNEIINNLRKIPTEDDQIQLDNTDLIAYKYHLITKYYETDILFMPYDKPLNTFPPHLQLSVEGFFVYFNANDREFIKSIPKYGNYLEQNEIELGILLCNQLFDAEEDGVTYKEAKQSCRLLDVVELGRVKDETDAADDNGDHHDPVGYDELVQVLKSFLWSNNDVDGAQKGGPSLLNQLSSGHGLSQEGMEDMLTDFDKLLTDIMKFKNDSSEWSRSERLAYTQNFAKAFDDLIGEYSSDEEEK